MSMLNSLPDKGEEISTLIELLTNAGQRLEELTAGQIDSVLGRDGRMVLLQHAQEQLRMSEAARQTAILNALPAHIALINSHGVIISINDRWQQFAEMSNFEVTKNCVGINYLEICDLAVGDIAFGAKQVAIGIRAVLDGSEPSFMIEYPHSLIQEQWYLMTVTPLNEGRPHGAVVMHVNITKRRQAEERLRQLALAMNGTADPIYLIDRATMKFIHVNDAACSMNIKSRIDLMVTPPWEINLTTRTKLEACYDELINSGLAGKPLEIFRKRKDGSTVWVEIRQKAELLEGRWKIITVERDINERKEAGITLHRMAHYDELTGLPNRKLFYEALSKSIISSMTKQRLMCVLFIDLDHFKNVNDTLGHAVGDELLIEFSNRLEKCVRIRDTVGRLGGDEFSLILVMEDETHNPVIVVNKIREMLRTPFVLKDHEVTVTASIGITIFPDDASDTETLLKYADTAMYRAKQAGRDTYRFFTAEMNIEVLAKQDLENALHKAFVDNEFVLYYQPKVDLKNGSISGLEALLRWQRPGIGIVTPALFIPSLEETGLIVAVGSWVIQETCRQIRSWMNSSVGPIQVAVNVSSRQFTKGDLNEVITKALEENNVPAHLLELELTESTLMVNTKQTVEILQGLKNKGVHISIDDFGTGYSSLAYLRRFPIDKLKIDIAFIRNITTNADDAAITQTIIQMAHSLNLEVVAEGVETIEQLKYLKSKQSDQIQGNYFSRPLPADEMEQMLLVKTGIPLIEMA